MTISVVQSVAAQAPASGPWTAAFASNVTAGNTIILMATGASNGAAMSSSSPKFNGATPAGSFKAFDASNVFGSTGIYEAIWVMPNVAGGATGVSLIVSGGAYTGPQVGMVALEVSGLGSAPVTDQTHSASSAGGSSAVVTSGTTGAVQYAPELVLGIGMFYGAQPGIAGSPWTELQFGSDYSAFGYQVIASAGGTYAYTPSTAQTAASLGIIATLANAAAVPPVNATSQPVVSQPNTATPVVSAAVTSVSTVTESATSSPVVS